MKLRTSRTEGSVGSSQPQNTGRSRITPEDSPQPKRYYKENLMIVERISVKQY